MAFQPIISQHESWSDHFLVALLGVTTLYIVFTLSVYSYNLFLHPLRHIKGPPLARISTAWSKIGRYYGCKSERIHEAHLQYGPVVRVGPNEVSFADPQAVRQIYESTKFVKEQDFYSRKRMCHEEHTVTLRDPIAHRKRRKLLARGFSQAAMLEFEPEISSKIQTMLDHWARLSTTSDRPIETYSWTHWLTFDTVYHLMFDEDPGSVSAGKAPAVMSFLKARKPTETWIILVPGLEDWGRYVPGPIGDGFRKMFEWKALAVELIRRCKTQQISTPFLRSVLSGEKDEFLGRELTDSEIATEGMGGMAAGSGTTASTFVYVLWACLRHKEVATKLRAELREAFPDSKAVPDFSECQHLPYLQAVLHETLRLYPTIIATIPRTAKTDVTVAGTWVPAGVSIVTTYFRQSLTDTQTIVGTQNLTIHQDPVAFPNPTKFRPERWLGEGAHNEAMKAAWHPFSTGTRKCLGINLALMELLKLTAAFFLRFGSAEIDATMKEEDMRMWDSFNARPVGEKLLIHVKEA